MKLWLSHNFIFAFSCNLKASEDNFDMLSIFLQILQLGYIDYSRPDIGQCNTQKIIVIL